MADYLKLFRSHEEYEEYISHCEPIEPLDPDEMPQDPPKPNHVIFYEAESKLPETESESSIGSLHLNSFNTFVSYHDFEDGVGTIIFESDVTSIGYYAFNRCSGLTSIVIPDSVTSIGYSAFINCTSLESIVIPDSVISIGYGAFYNCSGLTSCTIGNGVTSIGGGAFTYCSGLINIMVNAVTPPTLGNDAFSNTNNCPIYVPASSLSRYKSLWSAYEDRIFPDDPSYAERWVEDGTMCDNYDLYVKEKLQVSHDSGTTWGDGGETRKGELIEAKSAECGYDPSYNKMITYNSASKLVETTSNKDTGLPTNAFNTSITNHTFSNGVGEIGFENDVTSVGSYAFYNCGITNIEIPNSVTSIGESAFYGCSGLTSIDVLDSVTNIGNYAFAHCSGLPSINIPSGVTNIGSYAFQSCTSLENVVIPDSVTSIGNGALYYCSGLTSVTIGSGVTSIDGSAFYGCSGLTSITSNAVTPPTLGNNTFSNTNNCPIYVPSASVNAYKSASGWNTYASRIQAII